MQFKAKTLTLCLATVGMFTIAGTGAFAETTVTWKSHGVSFVVGENHTMADGSISQIATVKFVEMADDGDFKGQTWSGACFGRGAITAKGDYTGVWPCDANLTADDSWTFVLTDQSAGGEIAVTGGKGKYKGVTGKGKLTYTWGDVVGFVEGESVITWTAEYTVTLP